MKKLSVLLMTLFLAGAFFSCTNEMREDEPIPKTVTQKGKKKVLIHSEAEKEVSSPVSNMGIVPYIIAGENNGGNRTCLEVAHAWDKDDDYFLCGEKIDYEEYEGWQGDFPEGLKVNVFEESKTLSFLMDECIKMGDKYYKVGAVIVKGGNAANVYFYENGTLSDKKLAAPDGKMISNLTFCFIECEKEKELILAVKSFYSDGSNNDYTISKGEYIFDGGWCGGLGINTYPETTEFDLRDGVGNVKVEEEEDSEGKHFLVVTVDLTEGLLLSRTHLYVGSRAGITDEELMNGDCPDYPNWPYKKLTQENTHIFKIEYDSIIID